MKRTTLLDNKKVEKQRALVLKRMGLVRSALFALCDSFLVRAGDDDTDPMWIKFYEIQMSIYLLGKKNLEVSPPEGDMVHDLIKDVWGDVKSYMEKSPFGPVENVDQLFKTIQIDFPWDVLVSQSDLGQFDLGQPALGQSDPEMEKKFLVVSK